VRDFAEISITNSGKSIGTADITEITGHIIIIIIIIIIISIIYCNWVVTWWQWLFYMYTKYEYY